MQKVGLSLYLLLFMLILPSSVQAQNKVSRLENQMQEQGLIDIRTQDATILVDLKYATTDNFTGVVLYDTLASAYLHPLALERLVKAQELLKNINPNYTLIVYDGARPLSVQRKMYAAVQGTRQALYVANPDRRGLHNFGMAVDLSVCDKYNRPLDMGTSFDHLGPEAHIDTEEDMIERGVLTRKQVNNRLLLRKVMTEAGFRAIRGEWWHFNAVTLSEAWASYKVIE